MLPHVFELPFLWETTQKQGVGPHDAVLFELLFWFWEAVECRAEPSVLLIASATQLIPSDLRTNTSRER